MNEWYIFSLIRRKSGNQLWPLGAVASPWFIALLSSFMIFQSSYVPKIFCSLFSSYFPNHNNLYVIFTFSIFKFTFTFIALIEHLHKPVREAWQMSSFYKRKLSPEKFKVLRSEVNSRIQASDIWFSVLSSVSALFLYL